MSSRIATKLSHVFSSAIKSRGADYYRRGLVRSLTGTSVSADAKVRGSSVYEVSIFWSPDALTLSCTCPYFDSGPCKHLWAVVLAADGRGFLDGVGPFEEVILDSDDEGDPFEADEDESDEDESDEDETVGFPGAESASRHLALVSPPAPPAARAFGPHYWKNRITASTNEVVPEPNRQWPVNRELLYIVESRSSVVRGHVVLTLCTHDRKQNGEAGKIREASLYRSQIHSLPVEADREVLSALIGGSELHGFGLYMGESNYTSVSASQLIRYPLSGIVLPLAARTGRCFLRTGPEPEDLKSLAWDEAGPWTFELEVRPDEAPLGSGKPGWLVAGVLRRDGHTMDIAEPDLLTPGGHVFANGLVAPVKAAPADAALRNDVARRDWMLPMRRDGHIRVPAEDGGELIATLLSTPGLPKLELPPELQFVEAAPTPRPCLRIQSGEKQHYTARLKALLTFDYDGLSIKAFEKLPGLYDAAASRYVRRDRVAEQNAMTWLEATGFKFHTPDYYQQEPRWELAPTKLPLAVRTLLQEGWHVEADGKAFRSPGSFQMTVSSGVDWFELHANVAYGGTSAGLPQLLAALQRGENTVLLADGSLGLMPEEWLRRIGTIVAMGTGAQGADHIRFRRSQAGLLDALLATQPEATFDKVFARVRDELSAFRSIEAVSQPVGFVGQLRDYQREGLGWMEFLRRFSFGGCLADDMGVGKTAQVLALLESRRDQSANGGKRKKGSPGHVHKPSLVVVPRSLLFNWRQEAARFTPQLRVLDYTGLSRDAGDFSAWDLVLTTYGTLRRDAVLLKDVAFDYVILDEAQAIKNAGTESSKAVRLLQCEHRLALSGTPIENHLGELWSLFEFLNPGMLGAAGVFKLTASGGRVIDEDSRRLLSQALRPFILRRTKAQVAKELPAKTEQTIYCELEPKQRKLYDELRKHYRDSLLNSIETRGLAKSKIMVLEALLRLRQAACHPGLIDVKRSGETSAKLEALMEQLREVLSEGHKALVFSQFTSLLKIVRAKLDADGVVYEYLDGKTRDRQACVERFQNDPACSLFLISLKAGGLGLNLTAAEYVFLLDPWWNPAVEAQAVDRAHRIGQLRPVFAYRLIARDTVEEKVLELQKTKRDLADAIIGEDNALIRNLKREDLELLLS